METQTKICNLSMVTMLWPGLFVLRMAFQSLRRSILNQHVLLEFGAAAGLLDGVDINQNETGEKITNLEKAGKTFKGLAIGQHLIGLIALADTIKTCAADKQ